jgi:hypothetical protein
MIRGSFGTAGGRRRSIEDGRMSSTLAEFVFDDPALPRFYGIYQGTSDIMGDGLFPTAEMAWENNGHSHAECKCQLKPCLAISHYGGGFAWRGSGCPEHWWFKGPRDPYERKPLPEDPYGSTEIIDVHQAVKLCKALGLIAQDVKYPL